MVELQSVLIIDDSEDYREFLQRLMRGYPTIGEIGTAETGYQGIAAYQAKRADCVLMDFNLPGQNGLAVLEQLKSVDRYASVVMLTGEGNESIAVAAMKAGASDYVVKDTISAAELQRAINNAVEKTALRREIDLQREEQEVFLRTLLHDARAPLRQISNFSGFLGADVSAGDFAEVQEHTEAIRTATKRIQDLLDTLASYALAETNVTFKAVSMADVVAAAKENLAQSIDERQAVIRDEALPRVTGHMPQLVQLMQNLIGNGIKYAEATPPIVAISARPDDKEESVRFSVQDNGIGIPEDRFTYVFQPFKRLWSEDVYEGTGLGLAICKKIVERHGGRIWCESQEGRGSTFHFTLRHAQAAET